MRPPETDWTFDPASGKIIQAGRAGGASPDVRSGTTSESSPNQAQVYNMRTQDGGKKAGGDKKKSSDPTRTYDPTGGSGSADDPGGPQGGPPTDSAGTTAGTPPIDHSAMLGIYNLPTDVQNKVNAIFAQTGDVSQATALAMAYIRGTPWYAQTYPGIQEGLARGIISNEADYRNYLNNVNLFSRQYNGRDVSGQEIAGYLQQGYTPDRIGRIYQGGAIANVNRNDWNYVTGAFDENGPLNANEQAALGQEQAGIDTELGQKVQRRLALAQQRLQGTFRGSLATPSLSLAGGRLSAPSLGGTQASDLAA